MGATHTHHGLRQFALRRQTVGGPKHGYKHLVDSSLDWGQDLPTLKKWLDENAAEDERVYLSYFGTSAVDKYGIAALPLPSSPNCTKSTVHSPHFNGRTATKAA